MSAHGKYVRAVWVEASNELVEFAHRSHWLLIDFFDDISALQFRQICRINDDPAHARWQIKTSGQIGRQFTNANRAERVRITLIFIRVRIRRIWLRQRIARIRLSRPWNGTRGLNIRRLLPKFRRHLERLAVAHYLEIDLLVQLCLRNQRPKLGEILNVASVELADDIALL